MINQQDNRDTNKNIHSYKEDLRVKPEFITAACCYLLCLLFQLDNTVIVLLFHLPCLLLILRGKHETASDIVFL